MMKIATIAALIGSASAFAPANVGKVRLIEHYILLLTFFVCVWTRMCSTDEREIGLRRIPPWIAVAVETIIQMVQHKTIQNRTMINYSIKF